MTKPEYIKLVPLTGGMSNNTSLVRLAKRNNDLCVLKEFGFMSDFFVDKKNLFDCTKRIHEAGFGPDAVYYDNSCFFGLFAPGEVCETLDDTQFRIVVDALREMHTACDTDGIRKIDPTAVLDRYHNELMRYAGIAHTAGVIANVSKVVSDAKTALIDVTCVSPRSDKDVLCHGDAQLSNIVFLSGAGGVNFIDCEFSGVGDPVLDLAALTNRQSEFSMEAILHQYFGTVDSRHHNELRKRFVAYKIYSDVQWALLALIKYLASDGEYDSLYDIAMKYLSDAQTWIGVYENFGHLY